ncbi:MAG: hypothetical protein FVQ81_05700 [Candidatus Glassbacteria bacterium]|nr:hypothetical protein [Candidatus Glassbacteria bacterium]
MFSVWGVEPAVSKSMYVSAEGRLLVPPEGVVDVAGLSLAEAERHVAEKLHKYFTRDITISLTLVNPRTFRAYITGAVRTPGAFKATALDRVNDLIRVAGGIQPGGSMRRIRLYDNDRKLLKEVDMLRYKSSGKLADNPQLSDGAIVEVPAVEDYVILSGRFPYIYGTDSVRINNNIKDAETQYAVEFFPGETLLDLLELTGVPQMDDTSLVGNVMVSRGVPSSEEVEALTRDMLTAPLEKGQYYEFPMRKNWVYVTGSTNFAGEYQYRPGWTVQDYLGHAGAPNWLGSSDKIVLRRSTGGEYDAALTDPVYPGDMIYVPEKFRPDRYITIGAGVLGTLIIVLFR